MTEKIQAKVALRSIVTDLAAGADYTCYFTLSDFKYYYRNGLIPNPTYFGLLTTDAPPRCKPAYYAFQNLCALFDGDTVLSEDIKIGIELEPFPAAERFTFQELQIRLKTGIFTRNGWPFVAFWNPVDLIPAVGGNSAWQGKDVMVQVWTAGKQIKSPIVLDPLTGAVYEPDIFRCPSPRTVEVGHVPIRDYPMILTDRDALGAGPIEGLQEPEHGRTQI